MSPGVARLSRKEVGASVTRSPLEIATIAGLILMLPSVCAADSAAAESNSIQLVPDRSTVIVDPCKNLVEPATMTPCTPARSAYSSAITSPAWARFELDSLRQERRRVRLAGPSFGIAFSVLGLVAGAWLLAIGVEGARGPTEVCGYGEPICISRPAPYAGSVLMGLSTFGMARSGKKASERAKRRRHLNRRISVLARR
jgi:hypothetical protein